MKTLKLTTNKILSVFLALTIVLSLFSGIGFSAAAATTNPYFNKVADPSTMDGWKEFFGSTHPSTENAGAVWTDKSVFADASQFTGLTDAYNNPITPSVTDRSFLVALSAIASNKSIVGYSHIPTDTVLVLDVSGSMGPVPYGQWQNANRYNDAVAELVLAANAAVDTLLKLNNNNRVGVVIYSSTGSQFLAVDRYTATNKITYDNGTANDTSDDIEIGEYFTTNNNGTNISVASGVEDSKKNTVRGSSNVTGATYIQDGLMEAADVFKAISAANDTVISGDGFQSGTQRKPVVVLMSDGAPTYASTDYKALSNRNLGSGSSTAQHYAFVTQLTAAYAKKQITSYYNGSEALIYTLGLGVGNDAVAKSTLDPLNSTPTIAGYWEDYKAATNGSSLNLVNNTNITVDSSITDINYSDGYFAADTKAGLFGAFEKIVNEIIIQSLYRPTLVEENNAHMDGYIEFIDDIGDYMHVHSIKGIMVGNKLYSGQKLAENFQENGGELGTVNSPNDLGNHLIWAVQQRLGITDVEVARQLVKLAYEDGQLRYTSSTDYSNYIGWYADKDGKFLGFWDKDDTYLNIPKINGKKAKYINKSYGMLGEIKSGLNVSDLMYVSIQVHTEIAENDSADITAPIEMGHSQLIFRIPASLIPVVSYDITLEGTGYENARNIEMTVTDAEPIRLLFEVGLRHDVNEYNIQEALANSGTNHKGADGKYRFYTNEYSVEQFEKERNENNPQYIAPTDSINTLSYFEPNLANERYYYTEPTPIYVKNPDGSYSKYSSDSKPVYAAGTFFRKLNVFELTAATNDGNAAVLLDNAASFEEISEAALKEAVKSETNGGWNIPKDIIHRFYDHVETKKGANGNPTNTLEYSFFPTVEHLDGVHYYADAILGNNGLLTVTPATGLSITKTVDASMLGTNNLFVFKISGAQAANQDFELTLRDPDNNYLTVDIPKSFDANGDATVSLGAGWTAYLTNLPTGDYTVTEVIPQSADYEAIEKPSGVITVEQDSITPTAFKNALKQSGYLVIAKEVTHPFGANPPASLLDKEFTFEITLSNGNEVYPDNEVEYHYASAPADIKKAVVQNKKLQINIKADDSAILKIRDGWTVSVEEINLPEGFSKLDVTASDNKTVTTSHNVVYDFVNRYAPESASVDGRIYASKMLDGKIWDWGLDFTFILSRYDAARGAFVKIAEETASGPSNDGTKDFGEHLATALRAQSFYFVGTYHFSISEVVPQDTQGITYDTATRDFHIVVTDEDTDGRLEATIHAGGRTSVTGDKIYLERFINTYKADGIAEVTLEIQKNVAVPGGADAYSPEGFEFGIYNSEGTLIGEPQKTDANGKAQFVLTFNADDVSPWNDKIYNYTIKETKTALAGMTYADDIPVTITVKDNLDGTISAAANVGTLNNNGVYEIPVTNRYNPEDTKAQVTVQIDKTVKNTGTDKIGPGGFKFEIAENIQTANAELVLGTVTTDENGKAQFTINFTPDDIGLTVYTVKEVDEGKANVTYSDKVYTFTINVALDADNKLIATVTSQENIVNGTTVTAAFENTYSHDLPKVKLESKKTQSVNGAEVTDKVTKVAIGDTVTYSITLTNSGEIIAKDITVTDKIPAGLTIVDGSISDNGTLKDGVITWNIDALDVGKTVTVSFKVTVPKVEDNTAWKNIATVVYDKDHDDTPDEPDSSNEVELIFELPDSPKTADITNFNMWLALFFVSGSSLALAVVYKKRQPQENN